MKVKIQIDDGNGKKAELELENVDQTNQAVIIQSVFELFKIDTDFLKRAQKMSEIEKVYSRFMSELDPIEPPPTSTVRLNDDKERKEEIKQQMEQGLKENKETMDEAYKNQNDQPEYIKTGIKVRNGIKLYQTRYECYACYYKGTMYLPEKQKHLWCRRCSHQLDMSLATPKPFPERDSFGNYYVAGDFKDRNLDWD